jgi:Zn-dependent protease with chaperone function
MKRIVLFIATNLAVVLVLSVVLRLLGLDRAMYSQTGMSTEGLLVFSAVVGFGGAIFSLLISKQMAKWSTGARVIEQPANDAEVWLVETVRKLATKAGVGMPDVAIYDGVYTNVFWGGRSEIKPSEISPLAYRAWCGTMGVDPDTMPAPSSSGPALP